MHYLLAYGGLLCQFLQEDLRTYPLRRCTFQDAEKVIQLTKRGGAAFNLGGRRALEFATSQGRGSVWLMLTPEQSGKFRDVEA